MNEEAIFHEALARSTPEEQQAYLDRACVGNLALRAAVEALLRANVGASGFLANADPAVCATVGEPITERPGTVIGPYKLLEQIGEGGFGIVFMAEQTHPVRRKVALKVLKPGMDTRQVVARFEAERQALAILDHPNIAKVFDAGATPSGRPFFVMELVKGVPITEFCDQHHLTPRQRLELFLPVCQAVQHAHHKGIIHRDLKPSNVLVSRHDTTPVIKVIDFGVAKALGQELTDKTLFTGIAQMIGTPLYMSPEQAGMSDLDIDTRSDIYSLGVLLYELLTGTTPFTKERFKKAAYDEIRRIIRDEEPPRPSTRLSDSKDSLPSISAQRQTEPAKLTKLLRGELDWIVMKALEKDRNRRYETVNGFAMDVQRYLADEHVLACPPSAAYRFGKFARRHKVALTTGAVVLASLVLGILGTTWQAIRATTAEKQAVAEEQIAHRARQEAEDARDEEKKLREQEKKLREEAETQKRRAEENFAKARKAVDDYFTAVSESQLLKVSGMQVLRRELLQAALSFYEQFLRERGDDPSIRAGVASAQLRVGKIMQDLGDDAKASKALQAARASYESALRDDSKDLELKAGLAECWNLLRDYDKAIALREELLHAERQSARFKKDLADSLNARGITIVRAKSPDKAMAEKALADYRRCVELRMELARDYPRDPFVQRSVFQSFNNIAVELSNRGHRQQALDMYLQANQYGLAACALAPHSIEFGSGLAVGHGNAGRGLWGVGRKEEALREFQKAADRLRELAQNNPAVPSVQSSFVKALQELSTKQRQLGQTGEAAASLRLIRGIIERMPRQTANDLYDLACFRAVWAGLIGKGDEELSGDEKTERREQADRAMEALQQAVAKGYADAAHMKADEDLAALRSRDDFQKLVTRLEDEAKVETLTKGITGTTDQQMRAKAELAALLQKLTAEDPKNLRHRDTLATSRQAIGLWEMELGKLDDAAKSLEQAAAIREELVKEDPKNLDYRAELGVCLVNLGKLDWKAGRLAAAAQRWEKGLALFNIGPLGEAPTAEFLAKASDAEQEVGNAYMELGLFAEAARLYGLAFERRPPTVAQRWRAYAWLQLLVGDQEGYRKTCAAMNERFGTSKVPMETHLLAAACLIAPEAYGDPLRWLAVSEKVAKDDPKATWLVQYVIQAHYRAGQYQEAHKVIGLRKTWGPANSPLLAMTYHRLGQAAQARDFLKRADEWYADTMRTNLSGDTKLTLGTMDLLTRVMFLILHREAKELIEGAAPSDSWQHLWQARMYTLLGQNFKAQTNFQAAVAARPDDPDVWIARVQVYANLGEHVKAEQDLAKAIALKPADAGPWIVRGRYFAERGEHQKADADFTKAAALTPNELNRFIEGGWWVVGPYPYDLKQSSGPEKDADPSKPVAPLVAFPALPLGSAVDGLSMLTSVAGAQYPWKACPTEHYGTVRRGHPTLEKPGGPASVYALTYVYSPDQRPATLLVGGDLTRVWVNGQFVHEMKNVVNSALSMDRVPVTLKPGRNTVLVKSCDQDGGLWFRVRLADNPLDRGFELAQVGLWKEAAGELERSAKRELSDLHFVWYAQAVVQHLAGDEEAYRRLVARVRAHHGANPASLDVLRTLTLGAHGGAEAAWLVQLGDQFQRANPKANWAVFLDGAAHYRAGNFEVALRKIEDAFVVGGDWAVFFPARAMAHYRLGQADQAREWLRKADEFRQREHQQALLRSPFTWLRPALHWVDWAYFEVFHREAKQLIEGRPPADDPGLLATFRALAWAELRDRSKAEAEFDRAAKLSPNDESLKKARENYLRGVEKFVVLDQTGAVQRKLNSLSEAIAGAAAEKVIEIRSNGPFVTDSLKVEHPLTIRAGSGFRPVIQLSREGVKARGDLLVNHAPLILEGLELQIVAEAADEQQGRHHAILQARAPLHVANCRLLAMQTVGPPVVNLGPICQLRNCEVLSPGGYRIGTFYKPNLLMSVENCCLMCGVSMGYFQSGETDYTQESTIRLTRNTIVSPYLGLLFDTCADKVPGLWTEQQRVKPVRLASEENIWDTRNSVVIFQQAPPGKILAPEEAERSLPEVLAWQGARNLYAANTSFLRLAIVPGQYPPLPNPIKSVADWGKYWGAAEPGSIEGKVLYKGGDLFSRLKSEPEKIAAEDFRLLPDSSGFKAGKDGKDLGAYVDLVGPGPAYERWRKTPEYQQWVKDGVKIK